MRILFIDGTEGYYPQRLAEKPTGGILTSLTLIPKYLASKGHKVSVLCTYNKQEIVDGVEHIEHPTNRTDFDVVVYNRNTISRALVMQYRNARRIWWLHDIVDHNYLDDDAYTGMHDIVALSRYCKDSYSEFYDINPEKFTIISNGVDKAVFYPGDFAKRRKNLYICASAPIKGLYPMEYAIANIKRWDPAAEIRIYSDQSLHGKDNLETHKGVLERLKNAGATLLAPVPQKELADIFREATALLMPNNYPEINSNLLLQAQACGLPVVASDIGSASEFIAHRETGMLTKRVPHDMYLWWKDFVSQIAALHFHENMRKRISLSAPVGVPSWDEVGEHWEQLIAKEAVTA